MSRIVIIGHESAGFTAASAARAMDREARITVIERRSYPLYHPCGIPFAISGEVPDIRALIEDRRVPNVDLRLGTEARSIDPDEKTVEVVELRSGKTEELPYDSLVMATGGYPVRPHIRGIDLNGVHTVRTVEDGEAIIRAAEGAKRAVVVGGGTIGVETSAALRRRGLEVLLVELMPHLLPAMLDQDMAELVAHRLQVEGIRVECGQQLEEIKGEGNVRSVVIGGEERPADLVILAAGVRPEVSLAREAGIELGPTGGIRVDRHLRTSRPEIFAAGDCAETRNLITGEPILSQLATTAVRMGRVAGRNAAGGRETFGGTLNTVVTSVGELIIASTGLTADAARKAGIDFVPGRVRVAGGPSYFPRAGYLYVKLLAETGERRVIGGQVAGTRGVAERANLLALAIQRGLRADELAELEYCYMPSTSDVIEPLTAAAEAILRKL